VWGKYNFLKPNVAVRTLTTLPKGPEYQSNVTFVNNFIGFYF